MFKRIILMATVIPFGFSGALLAQDSGFLSDYSLLEESVDRGIKKLRIYEHPEVNDVLAKYGAIMIDQPELIVAADSKVKSMKPDDMVTVAETMRSVLAEKLTEEYFVVDRPGPEVLLLRFAATNLYIKKAKRGFFSYTPIGAVAHAAKQAATDDIAKKLSLVEVTMEMELVDSATGEIIAAAMTQRGQRKDKKADQEETPSSWAELMSFIEMAGARAACRMNNLKFEESARINCFEAHPEPEPEAEE